MDNCTWTYNEGDESYNTLCDTSFSLPDCEPDLDGNFNFCPNCGNELIVIHHPNFDDEEDGLDE